MRDVKSLHSSNRLLITGTPLQNNLSELWSLLHFLMPDVFDKLEAFESWFDFSEVKSKQSYDQIFSEERKKVLVGKIHLILKPFLLRRVKSDVEKMMPKKREYVLYAPMTQLQRELYQAILGGTSRSFLEDKLLDQLTESGSSTPSRSTSKKSLKRLRAMPSGDNSPNKSARTSRNSSPATSARSSRGKRKSYAEVSDAQFFASVDSPQSAASPPSEDEADKVLTTTVALAKQQIGQKKLLNPMMQLRLCCDSPHNFFNPFLRADRTEAAPDETIVTGSGKMLLLDALLPVLFRNGHKVLIFSQFKTQLDILASYADLRGWRCCRIDGGVPQVERARQIKQFNSSKSKDRANLFLLSTRAGGQGINLTAADTVVLFDSDWNPQQDLQAQDRAHRIGQTRNVIVYRLATRGTVEEALLDKAEGKRRLEKLVIRKGGLQQQRAGEEMDELRRLLEKADGQAFSVGEDGVVLSERDLAILTDRSDAAYERAEKGLDAGDAFKAIDIAVNGVLAQFQEA
jgi:ATP-dependent DNA helicase